MAGQIINRGKGTWLVRVYLGRDPDTGKREYHNQTVHGTKKDAEKELVKTLGATHKKHLTAGSQKQTIGALLDDVLLDYQINEKSLTWAKIVIEGHLRPAFGKLRISRFETKMAQRYIAMRQAFGIKNATINRELALLRRAFNLGAESTPPTVGRVPKIPHLEENNIRKGFFEHEPYLKIRAELPEEFRPVLTFGYYTGCRLGEILLLEWSQVDLLEREIRLEPGTTKNDEGRTIPLIDELYATLVMQEQVRDQKHPNCPWVFFRYRTGKRIRNFRYQWVQACWRAGFWQGDKKTGKPSVLFHDLRRTGVRNLVRAGVPERVAMMISGHKTRSVFDRYNIIDKRDLKEAARRLNEYMAQKGTQIGTQRTEITSNPHSKNHDNLLN